MMQADSIADSLSSAVSHPVTVQVINQGPGIWGSVATGLITDGAAIGTAMLTHKFTLRREKSASEEKQQRERYFIATELVFLLERFSGGCIPVASDAGEPDEQQGRWYAETDFPSFDFTEVSGDWRSLPQRLIYQLRELFIQQEAAKRVIQSAFEFDDPMEPTQGFLPDSIRRRVSDFAHSYWLRAFAKFVACRTLSCFAARVRRETYYCFCGASTIELMYPISFRQSFSGKMFRVS